MWACASRDGVVDELDREIADELIDPMTDDANPYNKAGTKYNANNDYNNLVKFGKNADGEWEITFGAVECPTMPYIGVVVHIDRDRQPALDAPINDAIHLLQKFGVYGVGVLLLAVLLFGVRTLRHVPASD